MMGDIPDCSFVYQFSPEDRLLTCIGQDLTSLPDLLFDEEFTTQTIKLDVSFNLLRNFESCQKFINLEELTIDNNQIRHTAVIPDMPKLHTLMINKNCIDKLEPFVQNMQDHLPELTYLSLLGNKACPNQLSSIDNDEDDYKRYRLYLIYKLPKLKFIDSSPISKEEREEAVRRGEFLSSVVRPESDENEGYDPRDLPSHYHPLPSSSSATPEELTKPVGTYGACKYIYYGRHSEGNRFIRNNDL